MLRSPELTGTSRSVAVLLTLAFAVSLLPRHAGAQDQAQEQDQQQESGQPAPGFADVPDAHVFEDQIAWLASSGITQGRGDSTFGLNDPVTRGAMAAFLSHYAKVLQLSYDVTAGTTVTLPLAGPVGPSRRR